MHGLFLRREEDPISARGLINSASAAPPRLGGRRLPVAISRLRRASTSTIQTPRCGYGHREAAEIAFRLMEMGGRPRIWVRSTNLRVQSDGAPLQQ